MNIAVNQSYGDCDKQCSLLFRGVVFLLFFNVFAHAGAGIKAMLKI